MNENDIKWGPSRDRVVRSNCGQFEIRWSGVGWVFYDLRFSPPDARPEERIKVRVDRRVLLRRAKQT